MKNYKSFITWSKTFACGIKLIDDQNKNLINLVNDLHNYVTGNKEEQYYFSSLIHDLVIYIKNHFVIEEKIMNVTKFPGYIQHKKMHESFVIMVLNAVKKYNEGKRCMLASISYFLKDWVMSHIAITDKQYFYHIKKLAKC